MAQPYHRLVPAHSSPGEDEDMRDSSLISGEERISNGDQQPVESVISPAAPPKQSHWKEKNPIVSLLQRRQKTSVTVETTQLRPSDIDPGAENISCPFTIKDWWWEIVSWAIGTIALAALLILLTMFHTKETSIWKSRLSMNAIIAALSQTSQSSLAVSLASGISQSKWEWLRSKRQRRDIETFDKASRGPLGSLMLIWEQIRWRRLHIVLLGAVATIFLVAFSTFAQQAASVMERTVGIKGVASMCRANNFTNQPFADVDLEITTKVLGAFSKNNVTYSDVPGHCSGKRCVWEQYNSLGICTYTHPAIENASFSCSDFRRLNCTVDGIIDSAYNTSVLEYFGRSLWLDETGPLTTFSWDPEFGDRIYGGNITDAAHFYLVVGDGNVEDGKVGVKFLKFTIAACMHTYRTIVEGQATTTTLLHKGTPVDSRPKLGMVQR
ncbi:hypothetical protein IQ07DRAFT_284443 [Pyrenochaeta sp. DS3sAY3a]|nr:hypothetical protein IQ07DRAFT_284443 [Pyrenochaeta sp. DS3sAY3a]